MGEMTSLDSTVEMGMKTVDPLVEWAVSWVMVNHASMGEGASQLVTLKSGSRYLTVVIEDSKY